jgi:IS30 family transposase
MYWPTMESDCIKYQRGCEVCEQFENLQLAPASVLHPIMKPWPFRGWGLNFNGEVLLSSSKGHRFILVAADYITKWLEAMPLRNMMHREVIRFIQQHVIHRFGIPQSLTTDQGASFMSYQFKEFVNSMRIKLLNSSPYYAQTNGQVESSNKTLIKIIKKWIESSPRK